MGVPCPEDNKDAIDQSHFWDENGPHWTPHRIGWAVAGGSAAITTVITLFTVLGHARHYQNPAEQRQIIRILYMPTVFAIISFFSYRFFREYVYYKLVQVIYESITISAFLMLLIQYVASTGSGGTAESALVRKDKNPLPLPFCCWRFRPTKPYFMYTVKWSVMQYTIIRPAVSIAGIVAETQNVLCESSWSPRYASVYLEAVDFVSISVALYGLVVFYGLTKEELVGRRPLAKFLCIKLIVMFTFYVSFVFSVLQNHGVIKETEYWTAQNVSNGLNALSTTIMMVFFALFMNYAYPFTEYHLQSSQTTNPFRALWDSINYSDFAFEIATSFRFFIDYARGRPHTRAPRDTANFAEAFGLDEKGGVGANVRPGGAGGMQRLKEDPDSEPFMYQNGRQSHSGEQFNMRPLQNQQPQYGQKGMNVSSQQRR